MAPFLAVVALENTWVHVCCSYDGNVSAKIKGVIYQQFSLGFALSVPDIEPDNGHIGLGGCFDNPRFGYQENVFK